MHGVSPDVYTMLVLMLRTVKLIVKDVVKRKLGLK